MTTARALQCASCSATYEPDAGLGGCACGGRLLVTYDLASLRNTFKKEQLLTAAPSLWRYKNLLPADGPPVTFGEGFTPLLPLRSLGAKLGYSDLWLKDDGRNPAASVAARAMSVAVTMARELGAREVEAACSPDEAGALAMYAAAAGLKAHVFVPTDISKTNYVAAMAAGAVVTLADGALDVAKVMEPYRIEGEKTIGFEIAEQFAWSLPEVILLPSGAGEVAISKALRELEQLGWIEGKRPKIIAIATDNHRANVDAALELARTEGIFVSPEGGACIAALGELLQSGELKANDRVVVLNPSSGFKHIEAYGTRFIRAGGGEQDKLGGLITPR